MTRLKDMAELRQAKMPAAMSGYVAALLGFSEQTVDEACRQFEHAEIEDYETRWPELGRMLNLCRGIERQKQAPTEGKFFCEDCASECGMLFFDAPVGGRRLRGGDLVNAPKRYARRCPCGGTETDWRSLEQDRAAHPERYFTLADVFRSAMTGVGK